MLTGFHHLRRGFLMLTHPQLRWFALLPIVINVAVFVGCVIFAINSLQRTVNYLITLLPSWLNWLQDGLAIILYPLLVFTVIGVYLMLFNLISSFLAAPFNGLLAERCEQVLCGTAQNGSFKNMLLDLPRVFFREWEKLRYWLPRFVGLSIISLFIPLIGQLLWLLFGAWMASIQYGDYPFDNHKISFRNMRHQLSSRTSVTLSFGLAIYAALMLPILNLLVMPAAVCGATIDFVENHKLEAIRRERASLMDNQH